MDIKNISSAPDYIHQFINNNMEQLNNIYEEGMNLNNFGILVFQCSEKENKMDVQFKNNEMMLDLLNKEYWENLKLTIENSKKRLFLVRDIDLNSIFLIYID
tara:strand:- start:117 stop:422 length:306 start_codon:yes stop_codon:yes gene_type:complete